MFCYGLMRKGKIMEFVSAIVDECGCVVAYCSDLSEGEIMEILESYPEYHRELVEW